jgi:hypothetical protein
LNDTINGNRFPNLVYLPDGRVFMSANTQAMIFDWKTNTETRLPGIPNGVRIRYATSMIGTYLLLDTTPRQLPVLRRPRPPPAVSRK